MHKSCLASACIISQVAYTLYGEWEMGYRLLRVFAAFVLESIPSTGTIAVEFGSANRKESQHVLPQVTLDAIRPPTHTPTHTEIPAYRGSHM